MKRHRHTPEQTLRKVREGERLQNEGQDSAEVLRHLEIAESTWNRRRAEYAGMKAEDMKRLRELERESGRLKRLVAEQASTSKCSRSWLRETSGPGAPSEGDHSPPS